MITLATARSGWRACLEAQHSRDACARVKSLDVEAAHVCVRPICSIGREQCIDRVRVRGQDVIRRKPEPRLSRRKQISEEDIALFRNAADEGRSFRMIERHRDGFLVAVIHLEGAVQPLWVVRRELSQRESPRITGRRLHLDHLRAEIRQQRTHRRCGDVGGNVEHTYAVQHALQRPRLVRSLRLVKRPRLVKRLRLVKRPRLVKRLRLVRSPWPIERRQHVLGIRPGIGNPPPWRHGYTPHLQGRGNGDPVYSWHSHDHTRSPELRICHGIERHGHGCPIQLSAPKACTPHVAIGARECRIEMPHHLRAVLAPALRRREAFIDHPFGGIQHLLKAFPGRLSRSTRDADHQPLPVATTIRIAQGIQRPAPIPD